MAVNEFEDGYAFDGGVAYVLVEGGAYVGGASPTGFGFEDKAYV